MKKLFFFVMISLSCLPSFVQAVDYSKLGVTEYKSGNYTKAIKYFKIDLKDTIIALGSNHPFVAASYNNLGLAYSHKGQYEQAIRFIKSPWQ